MLLHTMITGRHEIIFKEEISMYVFNFSGCQNLKTVKS